MTQPQAAARRAAARLADLSADLPDASGTS